MLSVNYYIIITIILLILVINNDNIICKNILGIFNTINIFSNNTVVKYKWYLPTLSHMYPNSLIEVEKVVKETINRSQEDIDFFYFTDKSVVPAFIKIFPEISEKELNNISLSQIFKIKYLKDTINRPRPYQLSNNIKLLKSKTANTPAFPAGHAAQAYILANYLQKIYPEKKDIILKIAERCNDCRIKAGLHYPSDGEYSKMIFYNN